MARISYEIGGHEGSWTIRQGQIEGPGTMDYATKEAAFEAAVAAAANALREGHEIVITVPGSGAGESTLGNEPYPQRS